jgi:predicted secreted Zn-dependent protease
MQKLDIANALRRAKYRHGADHDKIMDHVNAALNMHGVEHVESSTHGFRRTWGNTVALYVNTGETYELTLIFDTLLQRFSIESLGDFIERKEQTKPCRYGFKAA